MVGRLTLALAFLAAPALADDLVCPEGYTAMRTVTKHLICVINATPVPPTPVPTATKQPMPPTATPKPDATPQPTATPVIYRSLWTANTGNNKIPLNKTSYMNVSAGVASSFTETDVDTEVSVAFQATAMACAVHTAPGAGNSWVIALRDNGTTTPLTCTIADNATSCVDNVHTQNVALNHYIDYRVLPVNSPVSVSMHCALQVNLPTL